MLYAHGTADAVVAFSGALDSIETLRTAWGLSQQESVAFVLGRGCTCARRAGRRRRPRRRRAGRLGLPGAIPYTYALDRAGRRIGAIEGQANRARFESLFAAALR
jgi:hypothetical protein